MPLSEEEIRAILHLLEVENEETAGLIQEQLMLRGEEDWQRLESVLNEGGSTARRRLRTVLNRCRERFQQACVDQLSPGPEGDLDLEEGSFLLARCAYPDLAVAPYRRMLERMAVQLARQLPEERDPTGVIAAVNALLFHQEGFRGNAENYYDPDNSYLNRVLERRLGIPISLSVVLLSVSRRLRLPIVGVGMPAHFLVKYVGEHEEILVDPFHGGRMLTRAEAASFLREAGYGFTDRYLEAVSNHAILARMARNLQVIYERLGDERLLQRVNDFLNALQQLRL